MSSSGSKNERRRISGNDNMREAKNGNGNDIIDDDVNEVRNDTRNDAGSNRNSSQYQNRRKKADWLVKSAAALSIVAWFVAFAVWLLLDVASPDMWLNYRGNEVGNANWDDNLLSMVFLLLLLSLAICIVAFVFNKLRMRRKTDKYRKSVFVIGGITIIGIVAFLLRFGSSFLW